MPTYKYKCIQCEKDYSELRQISESQWKTHCDLCAAEYLSVTE
jgi:putative FmdB family regulatory protein